MKRSSRKSITYFFHGSEYIVITLSSLTWIDNLASNVINIFSNSLSQRLMSSFSFHSSSLPANIAYHHS